MTDKQMEALIKRIQKKCESLSKKKNKSLKEDVPIEKDTAAEMFSEMKKLPYTS